MIKIRVPFQSFKYFKLFNPHLWSSPASAGEEETLQILIAVKSKKAFSLRSK